MSGFMQALSEKDGPMIVDRRIDDGTPFDWGRASADYARYRDIYPPQFYRMILDRGLCRDGQHVLDLGTGTGVLPRNMARYGATWVGVDISAEQIGQARRLSESAEATRGIEYHVSAAEDVDFPDASFDVVTACQCFWYFDHEAVCGRLRRLLKPGGRFLVMVMEWLPFEDEIAGASERLVLKYSPHWSGAGSVCTRSRFRIVIRTLSNSSTMRSASSKCRSPVKAGTGG